MAARGIKSHRVTLRNNDEPPHADWYDLVWHDRQGDRDTRTTAHTQWKAATMDPVIDHVTIAARELEPMRQAFEALGLPPVYGGAHSTGGTHMALVGFDDGSYIELIAAREPGQYGGKWQRQIEADAGPCAWAARAPDIAAEAARVAALGVPVVGPVEMHRERPDGVRVEWQLAYLGAGTPGDLLPFLIEDHTPRELRVRPTPGAAGSELRGVAQVVLGVPALQPAIDLFRRVYGWAEPAHSEDGAFGARLARFAGTPVTLAEPLPDAHAGEWLRKRLAQFGPLPCAILLASDDLAASTARMDLGEPCDWCGLPAAWVPPERLGGTRTRLGVIAAAG